MALPTKPPFQPQFNYPNNKLYQMEVMPVQLNCTFTVASTAAAGITGLTGGGIANVFMHSSSPGAGNYGVTNPNPGTGIIVVQLQNQFNKLIQCVETLQSPVSGSALTAVTSGNVYTITALGTATLAQWQAVGLPKGLVPAVGMSFLATSSATIGGSATVKITGISGISSIEVAADPSLTLVNSNVYQNGGGRILLQCLAPTNSSTTTPIPTAPADGTVVRLSLLLSNSSVNVQGQ